MLHVRSANLVELASGLPRPSDRWDMGYQWIARFLANDLVSCDAVMQPFASEILARLAEGCDPVPLILDQSKVSDRHQVLMLSVRWGERALPVAWRVEETNGAIGFAVQRDLLDAVRGWLPAEMRVTLIKAVQNTLRSREPFSNRAFSVNCPLLAAVFVALPGSRFSPRSASAAATSGPKHRRCNVHNGLTCNTHGPTASLAAGCTLAPVGNPHIRTAIRMDLGRFATRPEPALAPTSGTARLCARCCAGSRTACGPARLAPCRGLNALRSLAPNPSGLMPA